MARPNQKRREQLKVPLYVPLVVAAARAAKVQAGQVIPVEVAHDAWCDLWRGRGPCNCNPEVRLLPPL